ncbi:hypothetical protein [Lyngbya confervoides]|uniref:Uncharacterized protein n=1 Tax=Lyngbya confervoides BDU141951 TaxID=1574623 RepID=A0ABD4T0J8_9CYAN|nr:hypothetical protein [Lyngbya confervoides]MCM1981958.1 hypothetical protein [Lyngbya confervoides BDU141951]
MTRQHGLALRLQPTLIRLIDQLQKQLASWPWIWRYETLETWPEEVPTAVQDRYAALIKALGPAPEAVAE